MESPDVSQGANATEPPEEISTLALLVQIWTNQRTFTTIQRNFGRSSLLRSTDKLQALHLARSFQTYTGGH